LKRAIELNPESADANYNLGVMQFNAGDYQGASNALLRVDGPDTTRIFRRNSLLAYCEWQQKHLDRALSYALQAQNVATSQGERAESQRFVRALRMANWTERDKETDTGLTFVRNRERPRGEFPSTEVRAQELEKRFPSPQFLAVSNQSVEQ
jgi:tetratricopeptide (TPR) repeat protein